VIPVLFFAPVRFPCPSLEVTFRFWRTVSPVAFSFPLWYVCPRLPRTSQSASSSSYHYRVTPFLPGCSVGGEEALFLLAVPHFFGYVDFFRPPPFIDGHGKSLFDPNSPPGTCVSHNATSRLLSSRRPSLPSPFCFKH